MAKAAKAVSSKAVQTITSGTPVLSAVGAAMAQSHPHQTIDDALVPVTKRQKLLDEIASGGLGAVKAYCAEWGSEVPDSDLDTLAKRWEAHWYAKHGVLLDDASEDQKKKANQSARTYKTRTKQAIIGYQKALSEGKSPVSVSEATAFGKATRDPAAVKSASAKLADGAKALAKRADLVKNRTEAEKVFIAALGAYIASLSE